MIMSTGGNTITVTRYVFDSRNDEYILLLTTNWPILPDSSRYGSFVENEKFRHEVSSSLKHSLSRIDAVRLAKIKPYRVMLWRAIDDRVDEALKKVADELMESKALVDACVNHPSYDRNTAWEKLRFGVKLPKERATVQWKT